MKRIAIVLAGLIMMAASSTWAMPLTLTLTDGTYPSVVVEDGKAGDINPLTNAVGYAGKVGKSWFSISTGLVGSALGNGLPDMLLGSVDIRTKGLGTLIVTLAASAGIWSAPEAIADVTGFSPGAATFTTKVNGNTVSNLSFPEGGNPFGAKESFAFAPKPEDVIELIASISPSGVDYAAFNYKLTPVPEGSTVMLLGIGFLGLAIYSKRRKNS